MGIYSVVISLRQSIAGRGFRYAEGAPFGSTSQGKDYRSRVSGATCGEESCTEKFGSTSTK